MAKDQESESPATEHGKRLREEIEEIKRRAREGAPPAGAPSPSDQVPPQPRSLRDIIHERMAELDKKKPE